MRSEELRRQAYDNALAHGGGSTDPASVEREIIRLAQQHGVVTMEKLWTRYGAEERRREEKRRLTLARDAVSAQPSLFAVEDAVLLDAIWRLGGKRVQIAYATRMDVLQHEDIETSKYSEHTEARAKSHQANKEMIAALEKCPPGTTIWDITHSKQSP